MSLSPTITIPGRDVQAGYVLASGAAIESVRDECTWFHGSAGRVADLDDGSTHYFHADLPLTLAGTDF